MDPKLLTEGGLKAILSKHKIKDNGLQRALAAYEKLDDNAHDDCLEGIALIGKLAASLKKAKEVAANDAVADYLDELLDAADGEEKDVSREKAAAQKMEAAAQKMEAAAQKMEAAAQKMEDANKKKSKDEEEDEDEEEEEEDDEEEEGVYGDRLLTAFKKLKSMGGKPMKFVVCEARPFCGLMVAKRISPKHKAELTELTGGSKKFLKVGECRFEDGSYVFESEQSVPGLARRLQKAVKTHTGKKFKIAHGGETVEEDDESPEQPESEQVDDNVVRAPEKGPEEPVGVRFPDRPAEEPPLTGINPDLRPPSAPPDVEPPLNMTAPFSISGSVGRGGKNKPEDVEAVQVALNRRANAGLNVDGKCGSKTIAAITAFQKTLGLPQADGLVEPGRRTAQGLAGGAAKAPEGAGAGAGKAGAQSAVPKPIAPPVLGKAELGKAPDVWRGTRDILRTNVEGLKKSVLAHYGDGHPELIKQIDQNLGKLDAIFDTLDHRLADSLKKAHAAKDDGARKAELKNSKSILVDYIKYVKTEPLIAHMDANPFGVQTNLKKILTDSLTHMAQSIGS